MRYRTPGAVVGFKAEAKILRHWPGPVVCSGAQVTQAMIQAEQILASGCDALLSFGIAGGLVAGMRPGSIIIATGVTHGKHISPCDAGWSAALASALPKAHRGLIAHAEVAVTTPEEKRDLHKATGALAADMESWAVACACQKRPFVILRAIADPLTFTLPSTALVGLNAHGQVSLTAVLKELLHHPSQITGLCHLGLVTGIALRALKTAVAAAGPIVWGELP